MPNVSEPLIQKLASTNFENANLSGAKLSGVDLSGVNFNGANLTRTDFSNANLSNAQLIAANLRNANLENSNLTSANFMKADLQDACLNFATLDGVNFESAQLINASFMQASENTLTEQTMNLISIPDKTIEKPYDQLEKMAFYDRVTEIYNRQAFEEFFEKELANMARYDYGVSLFLIDLDYFKTVNDTHGHLVGDALLKEAANRMQKIIRQGDLLARFGGDEFIVFCKNVGNAVDPGHIAQNMIEKLSAPYHLEHIVATVSASVGICYAQSNCQLSPQEIISRADTALYRAKSQGKHTFQYYSKFLHRKHIEHLEFKKQIEAAIENKTLHFHYQPIVQTSCNTQILGFETMLLYKGNNAIDLFDNILLTIDDAHLSELLEKQLIQESFEKLSLWDRQLSNNALQIYFNLSPTQLLNEKFIDAFIMMAEKKFVQLAQINIEIYETQLKLNNSALQTILTELQKKGINIVLDHFNGEELLITKLPQLPISKIKISPQLIQSLGMKQHQKMLLQFMIQFAHKLDIFCMAEGVDHLWQSEELQKLGCDAMQGEFIGCPVNCEKATSFFDLTKGA